MATLPQGHVGLDSAQELQAYAASMAPVQIPDDGAGGDVQGLPVGNHLVVGAFGHGGVCARRLSLHLPSLRVGLPLRIRPAAQEPLSSPRLHKRHGAACDFRRSDTASSEE